MRGRPLPALVFLGLVFTLQVACAVFFISDILLGVLGVRSQPISWQTRELIEIGAALGLVLGIGLGGLALRRTMRAHRRVEERLRAASTAFLDLLEERFDDWRLTPAEREVALFSIKGLSTAEIAGLRATSEGTVKAQTNAIYRKAGVSGRAQLLSLFIDDLMDEALHPAPAAAEPASAPLRREA